MRSIILTQFVFICCVVLCHVPNKSYALQKDHILNVYANVTHICIYGYHLINFSYQHTIHRFQKGNKLEVKWTINEDEAEGDTTADNSGEAAATMPAAEATLLPAQPKGITVWWAATLSDKTGQYHVLTDQDEEGGEGSPNISSPPKRIMKLPIYTLSYEPMEGE